MPKQTAKPSEMTKDSERGAHIQSLQSQVLIVKPSAALVESHPLKESSTSHLQHAMDRV
jgi:hypothetical protein